MITVRIARIDLAARRMDLVLDTGSGGKAAPQGKARRYPKRGSDAIATPSGPVAGGGVAPSRSGKWEQKTGQTSRNRRSKGRDRRKKRHR